MSTKVTVFSKNRASEEAWIVSLKESLGSHFDASFEAGSAKAELGQILCVDAEIDALRPFLEGLDRRARAVFLISRDEKNFPEALAKSWVDDVLIAPFRSAELIAKFARYQQFQLWEEVNQINASFSEILRSLQQDLELAQRIQKSKLPTRFPDIKGLLVSSRYLAGLKSGGDHFDLAESKDKTRVSLLLSDSSSYGLSSALLGVLVRVAMKLSTEESRSCYETVRRIFDELLLTIGEKDQLSLFYGIFSRDTLKFRYLSLGSSRGFYAPPGEEFRVLQNHGAALRRSSNLGVAKDSEFEIDAQSRIAVVSDGFLDAAGGAEEFCKILNQYRDQDSVSALNEFVFRIKSRFVEPDDLPAQDCTAVIFDVADPRVVKLR